jgi:prepilin-type N-terminal cleavage/methylation domain-containing protein
MMVVPAPPNTRYREPRTVRSHYPKQLSLNGGFTLIEIVLALAILSLIVTVSYQLLSSVTEAKRILDQNRDAQFIGNSILARLTRELQLADNGKPLLPQCGTTEDPNQPPIGSQINMIGEQSSVGIGARGDTITFLAREGGQYVPDGGTHTGTVQITYRVAKDPEQSSMSGNQPTYLLIRDEMPYRRPQTRACTQAIRFPVANNVLSFEMSYYDRRSDSWNDTWGRDRLVKLPQVIQFRLKLLGPDGYPRVYTSAVAIRSGT